MIDYSNEHNSKYKEIKFIAPSVCARNTWFKKLQKAKKRDFYVLSSVANSFCDDMGVSAAVC